MPVPSRRRARTGLAALALLLTAGCAGDDTTADPAAGTSAPATTSAAPTTQAPALTLDDAWVKAADSGMTAAFGVLHNPTDQAVTLVSATSTASARVELHEVVMADGGMVMRPKEGGILVPAGGEHVLEPGADHIMLMDLVDPVEPGEDVALTLSFDDGTSLEVSAQAKEFEGGTEDYQPGGTPTPGTDG